MCLDVVACKNGEMIGYKRFDLNDDGKPEVGFSGNVARTDRWLKATDTKIKANDGQTYPSGFHIFPSLEDLVRYWRGSFNYRYSKEGKGEYIIVDNITTYSHNYMAFYQVKYRDVVAFGTDNRANVVIAKGMKLHKLLDNSNFANLVVGDLK